MADQLRVVILKPSKYKADGYVERFRWGFMPNSTVPYMRSMTPAGLGGTQVEVHTIDEYVHTDLRVPVPARAAPRRPDAAGARGRAEPPVPSRAGPRGVCPAERVPGGHRRPPRDDLRHVDVARPRGELRAGRSGNGLAGDPGGCGRGEIAAGLWRERTMAAGAGSAVVLPPGRRTCAATSSRCSDFTRPAGVRSRATSAQ